MSKAPITLTTPIQYVKGVGEIRAAQLIALGIHSCGDLLFYLPRDYLHYTDEAPISQIRPGDVATIRGTILQTRLIRQKPRRFEALLDDGSGSTLDGGGRCALTWFNAFGLEHKIQPGMQLRVTGKVTLFRNRPQIMQPQYGLIDEKNPDALSLKAARIEPVYPATTELTTERLAKLIAGILDPLVPLLPEYFPPAYLKERHLFTRQHAMRLIHQPQTAKETITARRTLAYHEFFLHQAAMAIKRYHLRNTTQAIPLRVDDTVDARIRALLPFTLTPAQNRVIDSLRKDLAATKPMNRLLQGDVGSGKTIVALYAMLAATATPRANESANRRTGERGSMPAADSPPHPITSSFTGHQAVLMAPTEILAEQHYITLTSLLAGKKVKIALLTGSVTGRERQEILDQLADGTLGIVVGTHALLAQAVRFHSLALVVIDEQHKFGVEQRSAIRTKPNATTTANAPHILVMTATPIPRTLAMTAFGDLDVSVIDELPPGRRPIFTKMTSSSTREDAYTWLAKKLKTGEQAFIVVPAIDNDTPDPELEPPFEPSLNEPANRRIGESTNASLADSLPRPFAYSPPPAPLRAAIATQRELQSGWLKDFRVGLLHGRMNRDTRQHIMERFRQGFIDALVATTVIEVGVDVPNASIMLIEDAGRFGLSQLHQLRGRVGRGTRQSYCLLLADASTDDATARLQAMVKHASGFKIAEEDLKLRGMGHLIGTAQSGRTDLHFADLLFDSHLLPMSRRDAFNTIAADPRLLDATHRELRMAILHRFADSITLADVG